MSQLTSDLREKERECLEVQESYQEAQRKLEKAVKKVEKAKAMLKHQSDATANGEANSEMLELLEFENSELRKQVNCSILKDKMKSVTLSKCGHCFSKEAIDDRVANRMRRCPACNKGFAATDVRDIFLTW